MKKIFPREIIDNTTEVHRFKHKVKSQVIYGILLASIIIAILALPFVRFDVYTNSRGIIKSEKERNQIFSLYSGKIKTILMKENQSVHYGDTLLVIDNAVGKEKLNLIIHQLEETILFISDLNYLCSSKNPKQDSLKSYQYQTQHLEYAQKLRELQTRLHKSKTDFERQETLYNKAVISRQEFENNRFAKDLALSELNYFKKQQHNQWQSQLTQQNNRAKELESMLRQQEEEQVNYVIKAPVDGTIQNIMGLESGNFISAGNSLAEISPEGNLIAECYVAPSDIGLIKMDNKIKFQIDAYNYNQWGMATGTVLEISKDISIINDTPMFKIRCAIDQEQLYLKNGFAGNLKKGMTLNARFFIANRSAFELLYDKVDDWFNPSKISN